MKQDLSQRDRARESLGLTILKEIKLIMFSLDMVDCPVYSLSLSTWIFYAGWVEGIILSQFYSLGFCVGPFLHA